MRVSMKQSGICIRNRKLKNLEVVLTKWRKIHSSFSKEFQYDSLHWYNERANISVLAGAAWKSGEFCLEEYSITKINRKERWWGRADLWFTRGNNEYYIEAKQVIVSLSKKARISIEKIEDALKSGRKDAARTRGKLGKWHSLGIVFVVPRLAVSESEDLDENLGIFMNEIETLKYDIMSYTFPSAYRELNDSGYIYPGVVLIGKVPRRR